MKAQLITAVLAAALIQPVYAAADGKTGASPKKYDSVTSASVVPEQLISTYQPKGFSDSQAKKALVVYADPRNSSVTSDMVNTTMRHLEEQGIEVELRDLYAMDFQPVLYKKEFFYQKDGLGKAPKDVAAEQALVSQADYVIFAYGNWHDTPNAMVKGYQERVFAKKFAYDSGDNGPVGLLKGKGIYTIMNCGFLGGGRGFIGDGVGIADAKWDRYMQAFKVLDDDTAGWWGMENLGRFMNDRTPKNGSETYEQELTKLRTDLVKHLDKTLLAN